MEITTVTIENPQGLNFILGQSHFIKTVEDIYEIMVTTVPMAKFALAFCEASDKCLIRHAGTDDELLELANKNALNLSAGQVDGAVILVEFQPLPIFGGFLDIDPIHQRLQVSIEISNPGIHIAAGKTLMP